jgi:hypothetical protein
MTTTEDDVPVVAASEAELIRMARALVTGRVDTLGFVRGRQMPAQISSQCAALLADALSRLWPAIWRRGGARPSAWLDGDRPVRGRPWERRPPIGLAHSVATLHFLRWLVATRTGSDTTAGRKLERDTLEVGDELVIYLALDETRDTPAQRAIASLPLVMSSALAWIGFAHLFIDDAPPPKAAFDAFARGAGACVIEALGPEIARRWYEIELRKRAYSDPEVLAGLGEAQDSALDRFMTACDRAKRRDLASWILDAAAPMLERQLKPVPEDLDPSKPLSMRQAARRGAGALLRAVIRWHEWDQQHRGVRFIDDDYAAAQLLLARFERIGMPLADRAAAWLSELTALVPTSA